MSGETEEQESGWTVDTLKYHTDQRFEAMHESFAALRTMLDERYQTQTKATDAAFAAQQKAMETAFTAAAQAVQVALLSAEKAVTKAEVAAEKRFEAVNEFRGQLADQATTFMPRTEADAIQDRNNERITDLQNLTSRLVTRSEADTIHKSMQQQINDLAGRVNVAEGTRDGVRTSQGLLFSTIGAVAAIVVIVNVAIVLLTR